MGKFKAECINYQNLSLTILAIDYFLIFEGTFTFRYFGMKKIVGKFSSHGVLLDVC
jgi:hypothetical protein